MGLSSPESGRAGPVGAPLEAALLEHLHAAFGALAEAVAGLGVEDLNSAPAPDTNSLAVLVVHTIETARSIAHDLVDDPIPRDREAAFRVTDASTEDLQGMIDAWSAELDGLISRATEVSPDRPVTRYRTASQAWWLLQLLAHTREHAAHASLTRQLLVDRTDSPTQD